MHLMHYHRSRILFTGKSNRELTILFRLQNILLSQKTDFLTFSLRSNKKCLQNVKVCVQANKIIQPSINILRILNSWQQNVFIEI